MAKKRPKTPKADTLSSIDTRALILDAAIQVMATEGFAQASFQAIANKAGIQQPLIFYYFKNRTALVEGVIQEVISRNHNRVKAHLDIRADAFTRLVSHFSENINHFIDTPNEGQISVFFYYYASQDARFSSLFEGLLTQARERILEILYAGIREKIFHFKVPPEHLASVLHSAFLGACVTALATLKHAGPQRSLQEQQKKLWKSTLSAFVDYRQS